MTLNIKKPGEEKKGAANEKEPIKDMGKGGQDTLKPMQVETRNVAKPGDWIVMAVTGATEEAPTWVVKGNKFPKLYETTAGEAHPSESGFACYNVKPEQRTGIIVTNDVLLLARSKFPDKVPSQDEFLDFVSEKVKSGEISIVAVRKVDSVFARQIDPAEGEVEIVTRVKAGKEPQSSFKAAWGEDMPVAADDVLIYRASTDSEKGEVYRIARAEFDRTYVFDSG